MPLNHISSNLVNSLGRLSAAYVFTTPPMAKYICQFIDSEASFVNHVPPTLLCKLPQPYTHFFTNTG